MLHKYAVSRNARTVGKRRLRRRGLSVLELIVVVTVVGTLAALAVPRFASHVATQRAMQAAHRVVADLSMARSAAYATSSSRTVTFTVATSQYSIPGVTPLNRSSGTYTVQLNDAPYKSALVSVWGQSGVQTITFNGFGLPDKGGTIVISSGSAQKTVIVDAGSGAAVIQ